MLGRDEIVVTGDTVTVGTVTGNVVTVGVVPGNVVTVGIVVGGGTAAGVALVCPDPPPPIPATVVDGAALSVRTALPVGTVDVGASPSTATRADAVCEGSLSTRAGVVVTGASVPIDGYRGHRQRGDHDHPHDRPLP